MAVTTIHANPPIEGGLSLNGKNGSSDHDQHLMISFNSAHPPEDGRKINVHFWRTPPRASFTSVIYFNKEVITCEISMSPDSFDRLIDITGNNTPYYFSGIHFQSEYVSPDDSPPQGATPPIKHDLVEWQISLPLKPNF